MVPLIFKFEITKSFIRYIDFVSIGRKCIKHEEMTSMSAHNSYLWRHTQIQFPKVDKNSFDCLHSNFKLKKHKMNLFECSRDTFCDIINFSHVSVASGCFAASMDILINKCTIR
jgi:hypothetical protein